MEQKTLFLDKIPSVVSSYFASVDAPLDDALLVMRSDLGSDGNFCDCFAALFGSRICVAEGIISFSAREERKSDGSRVRQEHFLVRRFDTFEVKDLSDPKAEQLISTGRMVASCSGEPLELFRFSSACKHSVSVFCRVLQELIKDGKADVSSHVEEDYHKHCCPKCGKRYPDRELKVCPGCMDKAKLVKRLSKLFFRYRRSIFMITLAFALIAALGVVTPYISNEMLYDDVLSNPDSVAGDVVRIVLLIVGVRIAALCVNLVSGAISASVAANVTYDLKKTIFNTVSNLSLSFFTNRQTGGLMTQVNSDSLTLYWFFCDGFPFFVLNIVQLVVIMAVMFWQNALLALYTFVTIPVFFLSFKFIFNFFDKLHAKNYSKRRSFNSLVSDVLNGMRVVKSFSREDEELKRFDARNEAYAESTREINTFAGRVFPFLFYLLRLGSYVVWAVGGWQVMNATGGMTYGKLMTFIAYFGLIYGPIQGLADVANWWSETLNAISRLFEITDASPDVRESKDPKTPARSEGSVEFRNVSFSYVENRKVIDGVSFSIPAGTCLGIVGQTGAGKSTLANLLTRLYDPTEGQIFIDGVDLKELPFDYLRQNVAIVSQETYLFRGSILENIRYACPEATNEQVIAAAKTASAHDFIIKYPDGYDTQIGFGQKELSGGEKQRISIARALLRDPKILILDEATAAMDTQTERNIQSALSLLTKGRTTVIIAHRLSTLRDADALIALENGRVAEEGSAKELLEKKGVYYKLYKLQAEALKTVGISE